MKLTRVACLATTSQAGYEVRKDVSRGVSRGADRRGCRRTGDLSVTTGRSAGAGPATGQPAGTSARYFSAFRDIPGLRLRLGLVPLQTCRGSLSPGFCATRRPRRHLARHHGHTHPASHRRRHHHHRHPVAAPARPTAHDDLAPMASTLNLVAVITLIEHPSINIELVPTWFSQLSWP